MIQLPESLTVKNKTKMERDSRRSSLCADEVWNPFIALRFSEKHVTLSSHLCPSGPPLTIYFYCNILLQYTGLDCIALWTTGYENTLVSQSMSYVSDLPMQGEMKPLGTTTSVPLKFGTSLRHQGWGSILRFQRVDPAQSEQEAQGAHRQFKREPTTQGGGCSEKQYSLADCLANFGISERGTPGGGGDLGEHKGSSSP